MAKGSHYAKDFLKGIIEIVVAVFFIIPLAAGIVYVQADPNLSKFIGVSLLLGVIVLVVVGGIIYHAITTFFL